MFYPIIRPAKFTITGEDPKGQSRGMDLCRNAIDRVGGHPHEWASVKEVGALLSPLGFRKIKAEPAQVPTG